MPTTAELAKVEPAAIDTVVVSPVRLISGHAFLRTNDRSISADMRH